MYNLGGIALETVSLPIFQRADWLPSHWCMKKIRRCPSSLSETGVVDEALLSFVMYPCVMHFLYPELVYGCIF